MSLTSKLMNEEETVMEKPQLKCSTCQSDLVSDPSLGFQKDAVLCIKCDFTPEAVKKFYETTFSNSPAWAMPDFGGTSLEINEKPIFEPKQEMNPYLADVFALVDEDELAIRDHLFSSAGIKYGMLMTIARRRYVFKYAWAIPCKAALEAIAKEGSIVEVGAGTGYWAHLLNQMGCDIVAYDTNQENQYDESHTRFHHRWFDVQHGDESAPVQHSDRALFLCWPPYGSDMGVNCLKNYQGNTVICVGEDRGCTANEEFFDYLEVHFSKVHTVEIPVWWGLHDRLRIFKRNKE